MGRILGASGDISRALLEILPLPIQRKIKKLGLPMGESVATAIPDCWWNTSFVCGGVGGGWKLLEGQCPPGVSRNEI